MRTLPIFLLLASMTLPVFGGEETDSAWKAAKAIPKLMAKGFAGLTARGGTPEPERWLVLVNDEKAAGGVREFTVAAGVITGSKEGSDFAATLSSDNLIDLSKLRVDAELAADLVASYAAVNNVVPATYDYDLRRSGEGASPLWTVGIFEQSGARVGQIVIAADTGTVVSHEGFTAVPTPADLTANLAPVASTDATPKPAVKKTSSSSSSSSRERSESSSGNPWRKIGGKLQKVFTGRDTISR